MQKGAKTKGWCFAKAKPPEYKVDKDELRKRLTPTQFRVTQDQATERPYSGEYLKLKENGEYACVVCGTELFSSKCKFDSCGWPAFYDVKNNSKVNLKPDLSHVGGNLLLLALKPDLVRTEVSCAHCGAHLGHLFDDGPKPTGKRYCINSAALKFKQSSSDTEDNSVNNCTKAQAAPVKPVAAPPRPAALETNDTICSSLAKCSLAASTRRSSKDLPPLITSPSAELTKNRRLLFFTQKKPSSEYPTKSASLEPTLKSPVEPLETHL